MIYTLDQIELINQGIVIAKTLIQKTESGIILDTQEAYDKARKNVNPFVEVIRVTDGCGDIKVGDLVFFNKDTFNQVEMLDYVKPVEAGTHLMMFPVGAISVKIKK